MSEMQSEDEKAQQARENICSAIAGELRMAKRDRDEILQLCHEIYVLDEFRESQHGEFTKFAADELDRAAARLEAEKRTWPAETDCDRLDRVEGALRERGILFWQASPCCDTCTCAELPDRIAVISDRHAGFAERLRGYAFFIDQTIPETLADGTELSVYLAYGWFSPNGSDAEPEDYAVQTIGIAREVCQCLRDERFEPDWSGDLSKKIGVCLNWQRRTLLA